MITFLSSTTSAFDESNTIFTIPRESAYILQSHRAFSCVNLARGGSTAGEVDDVQLNNMQLDGNKETSNPSSQHASSSSSSLLPLIDTKTASLALRLTCETNRRLYRGTIGSEMKIGTEKKINNHEQHDMHPPSFEYQQQQQRQQQQQQHCSQQEHGQMMVPSTIPPAIESVTEDERAEERRREEGTIFHSVEPWEPTTADLTDSNNEGEIRRGISRWGPDIEEYLETLLSSIGLGNDDLDSLPGRKSRASSSPTDNPNASALSAHAVSHKHRSPMEDERQLILSLTLLYLDHSISLDTPRHMDPHTGRSWYPPCPQIMPSTVHRLVLTAMIVALKTMRGEDNAPKLLLEASNKLFDSDKYEISGMDIDQMEQWMLQSLGADASGTNGQWQISAEEVQDFMRKWSETFYPQRLQAHDERNRSRKQKLERFWREKTGAFGGVQYNHHAEQYYAGDHGHGHHWNGAGVEQYQQY